MKAIWIAVLAVLIGVFFWTLCKCGEIPRRKTEDDEDEAEFIREWKQKKERRRMRK